MEKQEVESPAAWRPEPGKTAWMKYENEVIEVHIDEINVQDGQDKAFFEIGGKEMVGWCKIFFPTAEAALASIKIYDLNGVEVPRPSMEDVILWELNLASRGRGAFLEMKDLQVKAKIEEAMRCNEAGLKSATSLHLGEALRLLKERAREGGDLAKSTLADHGITYNDERRDEGGC